MANIHDELLLDVCQILRSLVVSGRSLAETLPAAVEQIEERQLAKLLSDIRHEIQRGRPLTEALRACHGFPADVLAIISIGEGSNRLAEVLERYVAFLQADLRLSRLMRKAFLYPLVVFSVLFVVLPLFAHCFSVHQQMIVDERMLSTSMSLIIAFWNGVSLVTPFCLGAALLCLFSLAAYAAGSGSWLMRGLEGLTVRVPIVRGIRQSQATARLTWLLSVALDAGMPLHEALELASRADLPQSFRSMLTAAAGQASRGQAIGPLINEAHNLPFTCRCTLALAEESNSLVPALARLAHLYEAETIHRSESLPVVLVTTTMIFTGAITFVSVLAMFYPLSVISIMQ